MWGVTYAFVFIVAVLWILWRKKKFSLLKDLGIPGPEPNLFFGNLWDISMKTPLVCHKEWAKKYGKIFGYYMGMKPIVVVADLELLKKIQVSDFHKFINRPKIFTIGSSKVDKDDGFSYQMTNLRDKRWKEIRSILTPSFTTSKMRLMAPAINNAIDTLIEKVEEKSNANESFDIYKFYQGLTMDVIGRTAFGINTDCQRNPNDPFLRSSRAIFGGNISSWTMLLAFSFPELGFFWKYVARLRLIRRNAGINPVRQLIDSVKMVVSERRKDQNSRRNDLLQLMIDAQLSDTEMTSFTGKDLTAGDEIQDENEKIKTTNGESQNIQKKFHSMADYEIIHNAILFFLAGYETTSTNLAFTTHFLLHHQDVQDKLREEVNELIKREGKLDYTSVHKLQYMEQVLQESLRMFPPIYLFVNREAGEDIQFENLRLKKGLPVQVPAHLIQHDEDYWTDPDKFNPDRFAPENKGQFNSLAFQAFGAGPRNCVGMRFAQMEAKLALARILHNFKLVPCPETDKLDLELKISAATMGPKNGINLKAVPVK